MIDKIKSILDNNYRYYILNISGAKGVITYYVMQVWFKNNELKVENRFSFNSYETLSGTLSKKNLPVILHIEGDNIINKCVGISNDYRRNLIFKANLDDFYFYEYKQGDDIFVSVARKAFIDQQIKEINDLNLFVLHLSFGPFVLANLLTFAKNYSSLSTSNYTLGIDTDCITSFTGNNINNKEFVLNDDTFNTYELPLLASFFDYKFPLTTIEFDTDFLNKDKDEFKFKKWFQATGVFALGFILIALVVSHILLDNYLEKLTQKEANYSLSQQTSIKINTLTEEKTLKEKILSTSGISQEHLNTKYVADIGNSVPDAITLKTIHINPWLKKVKPKSKIDFDFNTIIISGISSNDMAFNKWVKDIKLLEWIKNIEIKAYFQESSKLNSFEIEITI